NCSENFRTRERYEEHFDRFHRLPYFKCNAITLNASDQIILEVKGSMTWNEYFKSLNPKKVHMSFFEGGKKLQQFEQDNNIEFVMMKDGIRFVEVCNN
ncbi:MAG: hypothetical protein KGI08_11380, partial [Thaumarchaeota archaeon]|nr:hypothetical protein [Nitrososphaerota archaeon]